jgi:hypothetical protein
MNKTKLYLGLIIMNCCVRLAAQDTIPNSGAENRYYSPDLNAMDKEQRKLSRGHGATEQCIFTE